MAKNRRKQSRIGFHEGLDQIREDAAGIDIGSKELWVDVGRKKDSEPVRRFESFTADLNAMADWLVAKGIKTVAMESTGVYWIPACQILEGRGIEVFLVNAAHSKNVSGRKSDMVDCQWLRTLHSYGLLPASFRPAADIGVLRAYLRHRQMLIEYAAGHIQHMQKALAQMNLQLAHVVSDITGVTALRIIRAILSGERDREKLAELKDPRAQSSVETIAKSLEGNYRAEHLFALRQSVGLLDYYQTQIQDCDGQISAQLKTMESRIDPVQQPMGKARSRKKKTRNQPAYDCREQAYRISGVDLTQIDGISESAALTLIAEIGVDMSRWETEKHFASWLTLCPNNKVSGGKVLQRSTRKSESRARDTFRLCGQSLLGSISALGAYCRRMCGRLGQPKGITAAAHKLALLVYRMLKFGRDYVDIGQEQYEQKFKDRALKQLARRAKGFGFQLVPSPQEVP
jgi:transposase